MARLVLLIGLLTAAPASAWGQGPPPAAAGDTLAWERVGDRTVTSKALAFDGAGALYAAGGGGVFFLDLSAGFPGVWVERYSGIGIGNALLALGADTLLSTRSGDTRRTTDGGFTWHVVYGDGSRGGRGLVEAPPGTPLAGALLLAALPVAVSLDRGATWEPRGHMPGQGFQMGHAYALAALTTGRLVAGGYWGGAYSDDGGYTWAESSLWAFGRYYLDLVTVAERPGGGERVVAVGSDGLQAHLRAWYSDDGGQTWLPEGGVPLMQPADGVGAASFGGLVTVARSTVLAVLGRGVVYRSDDGGATWAEVGRVPEMDEALFARAATVGPDGRVYVGLVRQGSGVGGWVWRTQAPVPVSAEPEPVGQPEGLGLSVRPNPSRGGAEVVLTLPEAGEVAAVLFDALGRRVAVLHEGPLAAGRHALTFDGASLPAGVYVVRVAAHAVSGAERGAAVVSQQLTLVR